MEKYIYASLNKETSICEGVSYLSGEIVRDNSMLIDERTAANCLGKKYENGVWTEVAQEPMPEPEPEPTATTSEIMAKLAEQEEEALNRDEMLLEQQLLLLNIDLNTTK